MKYFMFILAVMATSLTAKSQTDTATVGKIVYYEGKVELGVNPTYGAVKINYSVKRNQTIRTVGDAMAEIVWTNGTKSVVGPNSKQEIATLQKGITSNAKTETQGVFTGFKTKVSTTGVNKRTEEGGVRRTDASAEGKDQDQVYWKEEKEIMFSQAYSFYEAGEYAKAIAALQAFINQKPKDEMTKYAWFALGHSYIMSNNVAKAKEIFQKFVALYPKDALTADAEQVLVKL